MDIRSYYSRTTVKHQTDNTVKEQQQDKRELNDSSVDEDQVFERQDVEYSYPMSADASTEGVEPSSSQSPGSSIMPPPTNQYTACGKVCTDFDRPQREVMAVDAVKGKAPPGPSNISQCASEGPRQPVLKTYPQTKLGSRLRSFCSHWFQVYTWLEYSISQDAAYCFPCRFFSMSKSLHGELKHLTFISVGFTNWKNALENGKGILQHEKSASHKEGYVRWEDFKRNIKDDTSIMKGLSDAYTREIAENRHYIKTIAQVLVLTGKTKIAQREHRCNSDDINHGNVREILYLLAERDSIVKKKLNGPVNARYLHPSIQNEFLSIMAALVREGIAESLKGSPFSILADETKGLSKTKQLSVVVKYFHNNSVHERFLKFYKADSLDAESLTCYIFNVLSSLGIDKNECVGQGYDGASVMSGRLNGVQARVQKEVPSALYVHCMNHRPNLVIVDTVKNVYAATEFFGKLEKLYVFCSTSVVHSVFVSIQTEMSKQVIQLKHLSDTRWTCQYSACKAVLQTLKPLLETLTLAAEGRHTERAIEANGIWQFIDFSFILALVLFDNILKRTETLSNMLQQADLDLASAVVLVRTVIEELEEVRNQDMDATIQNLWDEAVQLSSKCGIAAYTNHEAEPPRKKRDCRLPFHLRNSAIMETMGQRPRLRTKDDFTKHFVYVVLYRIISELKSRFSKDSLLIMEGIQALNPRSDSFLSFQKLSQMATFYSCDLDNLQTELKQALVTLARKKASDAIKVNTILELTNFLEPYAVPFFELYRLCKIACVLPVSSASCERSFSALKLIKSYLRTTMTEERLSDLATLAIESRLAGQISLDIVIDRFASIHKNSRLNLY